MGHPIVNGELLNGRSHGGVEGTSGQETPGRGAGRLHQYQYAPSGPSRPYDRQQPHRHERQPAAGLAFAGAFTMARSAE